MSSSSSKVSVDKKHEQSYVINVNPSSFKGDVVDYCDFVRKWKAIVSKADLSQESKRQKEVRYRHRSCNRG